jgi:hypothetical protein
VNLICHSMGGIVARFLIQEVYGSREEAERHVNKWVTLGTPHRGIVFQGLPGLDLWELEYFNRQRLEEMLGTPLARIEAHFDPDRILCIVGTNHRAYSVGVARTLNQFASWLEGEDQNRSDGLVKQACATLVGAHRADVFKCHGGRDSLVASREAFELATRFFFGDVCVTVRVREAEIKQRYEGFNALADWVDRKPEFYLGFSVKPRNVDFYLNQQDAPSENCFGPIDHHVLAPNDFRLDPEDPGRDGILFEGFFNSALARHQPNGELDDLVFRFDTYVAERDGFLVLGHSDTKIVDQQSYFQARSIEAEPWLELLFYPRISASEQAQPIVCGYRGNGTYQLDLPFGTLDPDFRMSLEIRLEMRS